MGKILDFAVNLVVEFVTGGKSANKDTSKTSGKKDKKNTKKATITADKQDNRDSYTPSLSVAALSTNGGRSLSIEDIIGSSSKKDENNSCKDNDKDKNSNWFGMIIESIHEMISPSSNSDSDDDIDDAVADFQNIDTKVTDYEKLLDETSGLDVTCKNGKILLSKNGETIASVSAVSKEGQEYQISWDKTKDDEDVIKITSGSDSLTYNLNDFIAALNHEEIGVTGTDTKGEAFNISADALAKQLSESNATSSLLAAFSNTLDNSAMTGAAADVVVDYAEVEQAVNSEETTLSNEKSVLAEDNNVSATTNAENNTEVVDETNAGTDTKTTGVESETKETAVVAENDKESEAAGVIADAGTESEAAGVIADAGKESEAAGVIADAGKESEAAGVIADAGTESEAAGVIADAGKESEAAGVIADAGKESEAAGVIAQANIFIGSKHGQQAPFAQIVGWNAKDISAKMASTWLAAYAVEADSPEAAGNTVAMNSQSTVSFLSITGGASVQTANNIAAAASSTSMSGEASVQTNETIAMGTSESLGSESVSFAGGNGGGGSSSGGNGGGGGNSSSGGSSSGGSSSTTA